ncbi:MAG: DoxX family protein [Chitinophagaceae bacterium]
MKKTKIIYWIFTCLFAFMMLASSIPDIFSAKVAMEGFSQMGMPVYILPFLGIAKTLGVIAILVPGFPRIKEWAYAGLVFDLLGATYSIAASGQALANWIFMALPLALAAGSYIWYHKKMVVTSVLQKDAMKELPVYQDKKVTTAGTVTA